MRYAPALRARTLLLHEQSNSAYHIGRFIGKDHANISRFMRTAKSRPSMSVPARHSRSRLLSLRDERVLKRLVLSGTCGFGDYSPRARIRVT